MIIFPIFMAISVDLEAQIHLISFCITNLGTISRNDIYVVGIIWILGID